MQQVICPKCSAEVDASLNFCPKCGSVLPLPNSHATQVNQQHVAQAILNEGKKKENPKAALAVGLITTVLVIGIIAFLIISAGEATTPTVSESIANASTLESSASALDTESSESAFDESSEESSAYALTEASEESSEDAFAESSEESSEETAEESSEESSEAEAEEIVLTAEKPDDWTDIYAYIYTDDMFKNADWPGEAMTDNGDGTYSYTVSGAFAEKNTYVVFSTTQLNTGAVLSKQFPYMNDSGYDIHAQSVFTISDFEAYAAEKAAE